MRLSLRVPVWLMCPTLLKSDKPSASGSEADPADVVSSGSLSLENMEEEQQYDGALVKRVAKAIEALPSLESHLE